MISIYLQGGLGNQLFQIFTLIAYSLKHKIPFTLPETKEYLVLRMYGEIYKRPLYFDNFLKNLKPFLDNKFQHQVLYREKGFFYTELPFCKENMLLTGYFQSYKYFDSYKNNILKLIFCENYKKSPIDNTISIHFRIGDYKHNTNKHPVLSVDYYIKSLQHIIKKTNKDNWVIVYFFEKKDIKEVSEKIDNIKYHFKNLTFKKCDQNLSDWEEMISMSSCKHNIIANSTFSWWGAYLNENNDKIVCYPSVWFGNELQTQINDLFLDDWKKI